MNGGVGKRSIKNFNLHQVSIIQFLYFDGTKKNQGSTFHNLFFLGYKERPIDKNKLKIIFQDISSLYGSILRSQLNRQQSKVHAFISIPPSHFKLINYRIHLSCLFQ
jgi:hypothetical protein